MNQRDFIIHNCCGALPIVYALGTGVALYSRLPDYRALMIGLLGLSLFADIYGIATSFNRINNLAVYNAYELFDVWLIGLILCRLEISSRYRLAVYVACIAISIAWVMEFFYVRSSGQTVYTFILKTVFFLPLCFWILVSKMKNSEENPVSAPWFWFCLGNIMYHSVAAPYVSLGNFFIKNNPSLGNALSWIMITSSVFRYACFAQMLKCAARLCRNTESLSSETA